MYKKNRVWFDVNNIVTDDEIKKYFEDNKDEFAKVDASHILVEDEQTANDIKSRLDNGEDFASLAKEYSKDTASAQNGGALGAFAKGKMVKEFEDAAFSMKEGEISAPVKSQFGYHIIKVNSIKDSFEDSKEEITKKIKDKKYADYIKKLHEESNVVTDQTTDEATDKDKKESETEIKTEDNKAESNDQDAKKNNDEESKGDNK